MSVVVIRETGHVFLLCNKRKRELERERDRECSIVVCVDKGRYCVVFGVLVQGRGRGVMECDVF